MKFKKQVMKLLALKQRQIEGSKGSTYSLPLEAVSQSTQPLDVMLSPSEGLRINSAEHLAFSGVLRRRDSSASPQNDITTQSLKGQEIGIRVTAVIILALTLLFLPQARAQQQDWLSYYPSMW
jgi:hypothetical protein